MNSNISQLESLSVGVNKTERQYRLSSNYEGYQKIFKTSLKFKPIEKQNPLWKFCVLNYYLIP